MSTPHTIDIRVYYEDTDFSGFVYHANYLRFFERGRTEFLRRLGITQSDMYRNEAGLVFVVARLTVDYLRPARMDDIVTIETMVVMARGPLVRMRQKILRRDETLTEAEVTVVAVREGRPARLPDAVKAVFDRARRSGAGELD